ncbi:MAG TPA: hypothetical protein DD727_00830 [Clostridiales bacterium]|nr:hypothetical protein [Clostridiales bacterium]
MLKPLKRTRLYEEIFKQLVDLIQKGALKPGDRLPPERELAVQLNVSRTAIREALRSMELMGYIESRVRGGTFIRQLTMENVMNPFTSILSQDRKLIMELIEVRLLIEVEITRLAAQRMTSEKAEKLHSTLALMDNEIKNGEIGIQGDNAFHRTLAECSENTAMQKILDLCGDLLSATRKATLEIPGQPEKSYQDHRQICEAVCSKDASRAVKLMRAHLTKAYENVHYRSRV